MLRLLPFAHGKHTYMTISSFSSIYFLEKDLVNLVIIYHGEFYKNDQNLKHNLFE